MRYLPYGNGLKNRPTPAFHFSVQKKNSFYHQWNKYAAPRVNAALLRLLYMGVGVISGAGDVHGCRLELVDGRAWGWIDGV